MCLDLASAFYPALKELARIYDDRNLQKEALRLYRLCVQFSPHDLEANLRLATILKNVGQGAEAVPFLKTALKGAPGHHPLILALADVYLEQGRHQNAIDLLLEADLQGPMLARQLFLYGRALEHKENFTAAYDEAVSVDPANGLCRLNRALAATRTNVYAGKAMLQAYIDWAGERPEERPLLEQARQVLPQLAGL